MLGIVDRDLTTAAQDIHSDWRFGIAYNAGLKLCTILLYAQGYRTGKGSHHMISIDCLPLILSSRTKKDVAYLQACRKKRSLVTYDCSGGANAEEAEELIGFVEVLREEVIECLQNTHPNLIS